MKVSYVIQKASREIVLCFKTKVTKKKQKTPIKIFHIFLIYFFGAKLERDCTPQYIFIRRNNNYAFSFMFSPRQENNK